MQSKGRTTSTDEIDEDSGFAKRRHSYIPKKEKESGGESERLQNNQVIQRNLTIRDPELGNIR